jgi:hypothetical protein
VRRPVLCDIYVAEVLAVGPSPSYIETLDFMDTVLSLSKPEVCPPDNAVIWVKPSLPTVLGDLQKLELEGKDLVFCTVRTPHIVRA